MKKLATLALLLGLGMFAVGCAAEDASAPATTPEAPAATDAPAEGAPAEGAAQ